jgi:hypothetical protein
MEPQVKSSYRNVAFTHVSKLLKPDTIKPLNLYDGNERFMCRGTIRL